MAEEERADHTIVWRPRSHPQKALIQCPVFEVFFGGARGSLKTDSVLGDWINHASRYGEHAAGLMVRRTREELKATFNRARQIYIPLGFTFSGFTCTSPNGAVLTFAYLDKDEDAERYQGWSLTRVYVEEIGNFPLEAPIQKLMATLRSAEGVPVGFRATGNPGGPGHHWVKERYITSAPKGWEVQKTEYVNPFNGNKTMRDRVFIPGKITDHNLLGDEYIAQLQMAGSEGLVRAWLMGDWDVIEGAFFDCWSDKMVIEPFTIPEQWTKFISGDWGYAAPFSFGWWAVATDDHETESGVIPRGAMVRYREWYGVKVDNNGRKSPNIGVRMDAEEVAPILVKKSGDEELSIGVIDPATFATQSGPSIAESIMKASRTKKGQLVFRRADNKRVGVRGAMGGWDQMRARMKGMNGRPMVYCFKTCTDSIRTIPVLQHDPDKAEDLDTDTEDHAADDWRYACMSRPYIRPKPKADNPKWPYEANQEGIVGNIPIRDMIKKLERQAKEDY